MVCPMNAYSDFKLIKNDGITAIIVSNRRVLIMKRIWAPFIVHPGLWLFVAGKKKRNESDDEAAYREVFEETGLGRADLRLLGKRRKVMKIDAKGRKKFYNTLYLFRSRTRRVRMNFENRAYRWASLADIRAENRYTNVFADKWLILKVISKAIQRSR